MAFAQVQYTGDGTTTIFSVSFPYLQKSHLEVSVAGVLQTQEVAYTFPTGSTLQFTSAPASGAVVDIRRKSSQAARLTDYQNGTVLLEAQLNADSTQLFYMAQEALDAVLTSLQLGTDATFDAGNKRIKNLGTPIVATDAATKAYVDSTGGGGGGGSVDLRDVWLFAL
jgi:hypothetical protein